MNVIVITESLLLGASRTRNVARRPVPFREDWGARARSRAKCAAGLCPGAVIFERLRQQRPVTALRPTPRVVAASMAGAATAETWKLVAILAAPASFCRCRPGAD